MQLIITVLICVTILALCYQLVFNFKPAGSKKNKPSNDIMHILTNVTVELDTLTSVEYAPGKLCCIVINHNMGNHLTTTVTCQGAELQVAFMESSTKDTTVRCKNIILIEKPPLGNLDDSIVANMLESSSPADRTPITTYASNSKLYCFISKEHSHLAAIYGYAFLVSCAEYDVEIGRPMVMEFMCRKTQEKHFIVCKVIRRFKWGTFSFEHVGLFTDYISGKPMDLIRADLICPKTIFGQFKISHTSFWNN